jgi:hypothetical protein
MGVLGTLLCLSNLPPGKRPRFVLVVGPRTCLDDEERRKIASSRTCLVRLSACSQSLHGLCYPGSLAPWLTFLLTELRHIILVHYNGKYSRKFVPYLWEVECGMWNVCACQFTCFCSSSTNSKFMLGLGFTVIKISHLSCSARKSCFKYLSST